MTKYFATSFALLLAVGCNGGDDARDTGGNTGGKADDNSNGEAGELLACTDDDDEIGCLRHANPDWREPNVINRGWDDTDQQLMYHQDQGTRIVPISWLLALEAPGGGLFSSAGSFLDDERVESYGLIPDHNRLNNPFELPVGFSVNGDLELTETEDGLEENAYFGYTCTACHTAEIEVDGDRYRVNGGAGLQSFNDWNKSLITTLGETVLRDVPLIEVSFIDDKFDRFIERVQGIQDKLYGQHQSREELAAEVDRFSLSNKALPILLRDKLNSINPTPHGPGRVDALGRGSNTLWTDYLSRFESDSFDPDDNLAPIDGMVGLPAIYDVPKFDWAEYNHSIRQSYGRNLAEAIAVLSPTDLETLDTTVNSRGLFVIEQTLRQLQAPEWPEAFGAIDKDLAAEGERLFNDINANPDVACARCHSPKVEWNPGEEYLVRMLPLGVIGTDIKTVENFATREITVPDEVRDSLNLPSNRLLAGAALQSLVDQVGRNIFDEQGWGDYDDAPGKCGNRGSWDDGGACEATLGRSNLFRVDVPRDLPESVNPMTFAPKDGIDRADPRCDDLSGTAQDECLQGMGWLGYRARPLNGMWATAPFLHNNSVPNMCLLLGDPKDRPSQFTVGSIEFDAECLGYRFDNKAHMPDGDEDAAEYDARDSGNGNQGHEFSSAYTGTPADGVIGRELTDQEIRAIIEYVKSMPALPSGL